MAILSAPKGIVSSGAKSAPPKQTTATEKPKLKVNPRDPMAALDEFEYGGGGPARAYKHIGNHLIRIESVEEGDSDTGDHFFSVNGEIVETDSDEVQVGQKMRHAKTLHRQYPKYFMTMVAETTAAVFNALGEQLHAGDVKKYHTRQLTGGEFTNPETGEVAEAQPFDFASFLGGAGALLKISVRSEAKRDNKGKPTGAYENKVYVTGITQQ